MFNFSEGGGSGDYQNHPEGKFEGVIYCWKNLGKRVDAWGNTKQKVMVRIECHGGKNDDGEEINPMMEPYTRTNEDGVEEEVTMPFSAPIFFNLSAGNHKIRTGTRFPHMQRFREAVLDRKLTKEEWYSYDPESETLGVRVRYRVSHTPKEEGDGVWVNTEIIERSSNQDDIKTYNDYVLVLEAPEEDEGGNTQQAPSKPSAPAKPGKPNKPTPPPPKVDNSKPFKAVLGLLKDSDVIDDDTHKQWSEWVDTEPNQAVIADEFKNFLQVAKDEDVDVSSVVNPKSTGGDDLPF